MRRLKQMTCTACRKGEPTVTETEIAELGAEVAEWQIIDVDARIRY